tara:strand:- start:218 stop:979 length:762 start_codon:yes stop_codon:yes gene_type:complete
MTVRDIPKTHPRYDSLNIRSKIANSFIHGIIMPEGLVAHGRGEAFDYIIGEKTMPFSITSINAAVAKLLLSSTPVISINGNVASLVPDEIIEFSNISKIQIEINLFHRTKKRIELVNTLLRDHGGKKILGNDNRYITQLPDLKSNRRFVDTRGIFKADVVFVPLEDGDRAESLMTLNKEVITVDLNPFSRTAKTSNITIVDNIVRVIPLMITKYIEMRKLSKDNLNQILEKYDNDKNLNSAIVHISNRLKKLK